MFEDNSQRLPSYTDPPTSSPDIQTPSLDVPYTDPESTRTLWTEVASVLAMSGLPRGGGRKGGGRAGSKLPVPASVIDPVDSAVTSRSITTYATRGISPRNAKFAELILHPRGIFIDAECSDITDVYCHFGTSAPPKGETVDYSAIPGLGGGGNIWVTLDDTSAADIASEYGLMRGLELCEEEFATLAKTYLLRSNLRFKSVSEDRQWRAERMLQLVTLPDNNAHWKIPPIITDSSTTGEQLDVWSWDIRPDCSYWLSFRGFNPEYRFQIEHYILVRDRIICPYLTVEFKRDGEPTEAALRQVCAASAMALYNRWILHSRALKASGSPDNHDTALVRHYSITFIGHKANLFVLQPTRDEKGQWAGCVMKKLVGVDCTEAYAVRALARWINEIHRWGLSQHGPSCERDVKRLLKARGIRTSDIHESGEQEV